MGESRPKLLVLGGPHLDLGALEDSLGRHFQLVQTDADSAIQVLEGEGCHVVIADAGDFLPLERDLVARQASVLLNAIGEGVCLTDVTGRVLWSNAIFRGFDETVRRRCREVCVAAAEYFTEHVNELKPGEPPRPKNYRLSFRRSGRYYDALISPVVESLSELVRRTSDTGRAEPRAGGSADPESVTLVAAVVRDVTSARRTERKIDAIDRAGRELTHLDVDTIRVMNAQERLRLLERRVIEFAHELLAFDHFAIRMINKDRGRLDLVMSAGLPEDARDIELLLDSAGSISGYVAATGRSYISNDTTADDLYVRGLSEPGSSLTVPLRVDDAVVGIFNIESSRTDAFTDNDRKFAEIFAHYVATALHTLNLLVVERHTTSEVATGTVSGEITGPLEDLSAELDLLRKRAADNENLKPHLERMRRDVESIRRRMKNVARGPQTLLGVDEILEAGRVDPQLEHRRVLVADNEESVRVTIRDVLTAVGCRVVTCDDGVSAVRLLELWQHTHDADEAFDLVLSDISLGDLTGYDVFRAARAASDTLPVILITGFGYDPHHSIVRASQEGLRAVLFKPFQAEKLIEEVRNAVVDPTPPASAGDDQ